MRPPLPVAVIPARYASVRFPGKPLARLGGKPMIEHVHRRCVESGAFSEIVVATDDARIADAVRGFGGTVALTSPDCPSGTDRVAEVARARPEVEVFVNVQGDEPLIPPEALTLLAQAFAAPEVQMATLVRPLEEAERANPNVVKAVLALSGDALYFSRADLPFDRDGRGGIERLGHLGIYGYRRQTLLRLAGPRPDAARADREARAAARARARDPDPLPAHPVPRARRRHPRGPGPGRGRARRVATTAFVPLGRRGARGGCLRATPAGGRPESARTSRRHRSRARPTKNELENGSAVPIGCRYPELNPYNGLVSRRFLAASGSPRSPAAGDLEAPRACARAPRSRASSPECCPEAATPSGPVAQEHAAHERGTALGLGTPRRPRCSGLHTPKPAPRESRPLAGGTAAAFRPASESTKPFPRLGCTQAVHPTLEPP